MVLLEIFTCHDLHQKCPPRVLVLNVCSPAANMRRPSDSQYPGRVMSSQVNLWRLFQPDSWFLFILYDVMVHLLWGASPKSCICELICFHHSLPAKPQLSETETLSQIDLSSLSVSKTIDTQTFAGCDGLLCNANSFSSTHCRLASPTRFPPYFFSSLSTSSNKSDCS